MFKVRPAPSDTRSLLYAETSRTMSSLKACRTPNSNMIVFPKPTGRAKMSLVFDTDRSLLEPLASTLMSGVWTWCEYDSRKPVRSVTGKDTRSVGERMLCCSAVKKLQVASDDESLAVIAASHLATIALSCALNAEA